MQKNNECETRVGLSGNCAYMYVVHGKKYKQDSAITVDFLPDLVDAKKLQGSFRRKILADRNP